MCSISYYTLLYILLETRSFSFYFFIEDTYPRQKSFILMIKMKIKVKLKVKLNK